MNKKKSNIQTSISVHSPPLPISSAVLYQRVFELYDGILLILDSKSGRIISANKAAENFFQLAAKELCAKDIFALSGLSIEQLLDKLNTALQMGKQSVILAHPFSDGDVKYLEYRCSHITIEHGEVLFCFIQDVTSREHEEYLLQYRIEFESVISSISTYFIRPDHTQLDLAIENALRTVAEFLIADRCYILLFSQDLTKISMIHSWNSETVKPLTSFENINSETSPFASSVLFKGEVLKVFDIQALSEEAAALKNYKLGDDTRSFIIVPMISAGMVIGAIGLDSVQHQRLWTADTETFLRMIGEIITNALHRKRMEEALRYSENKYRQFFVEDLTGDYIADADGQIRFCNPAFAKIFGFSDVEEAVHSNRKIYELLNESAENYYRLLSQQKAPEEREFEFPRQTGEIARAVGNIRGLFNDQGVLLESRGYLFDITERKELEEQLRGAQRMEAIGRLTGGIAHDFNNILTVINGYCELLLHQAEASGPGREELGQIKKASDRAASLINQLLAFSRKQIVQPKVINLNMVVKDLESMLQRLIGENIQFETKMDPELGNIKIDPAQLEQVIMNLVVNARDAMPTGGRLTIKTSNMVVDENYARFHRPQRPGPYIMLVVQDTGIGMGPEIQAHIFEPFFTTKEKGKGTGLGLSTLYGIVKQSNGFVWVESKPGRGATFRIFFPVYDQSVEVEQSAQPLTTPLQGRETVLIVEDDHAVRELTRSFLQHYGYTVYTAESGEQALNLCRDLQRKVDLAVIDVIMPGMGCKELSNAIGDYFPRIKILFISGYTDEAISQQGVLEPHVAFLQKPFNIETLGRKVRQVLDSHQD
jgi:two-component system cell cycle sensor histidine kinase/response regulator CckA